MRAAAGESKFIQRHCWHGGFTRSKLEDPTFGNTSLVQLRLSLLQQNSLGDSRGSLDSLTGLIGLAAAYVLDFSHIGCRYFNLG